MDESLAAPPRNKQFTPPSPGEAITSLATQNTYTIGDKIGEGSFGIVFACTDGWNNDLAVKVLKPVGSYEKVEGAARAEFDKLLRFRHPYVTFVFDAFEFRDTFYIVTERCHCSVEALFWLVENFAGHVWLMPIARCLLQAVAYLHVNNYVHQDIHLGNVFALIVKNEMVPTQPGATQFKLGDLGVARMVTEVSAANTRAQWMLPPEILDPAEFGRADSRIDIYHLGLLFLQLATSKQLQFTKDEVVAGKPREAALTLGPPLNFALEKALRRHVQHRTATAMELWRDLNSPSNPAVPDIGNVLKPGAGAA